jgi:hypothetical protein
VTMTNRERSYVFDVQEQAGTLRALARTGELATPVAQELLVIAKRLDTLADQLEATLDTRGVPDLEAAGEPPPRFTQLVLGQDRAELYALDEAGRIWWTAGRHIAFAPYPYPGQP